MRKYVMAGVAIGALILAVTVQLFAGWHLKSSDDTSVVLDTGELHSPKVQNGKAYDKATINIGDEKFVVVPDDAKIEHNGPDGRIEIYIEKTLEFGGHPGELMSIRNERKNMGCVMKSEADKLIIATYGEWDSNIEGGAFIQALVIRVPDKLKVETRKGLSGPILARKGFGKKKQTRSDGIEPGENGWKAIADVPDPKQTAKIRKKP
jgi:hypothetical protein